MAHYKVISKVENMELVNFKRTLNNTILLLEGFVLPVLVSGQPDNAVDFGW